MSTLRKFLQQNRSIVSEISDFEIYDKSQNSQLQEYYSYYFVDGKNNIQDEGRVILNSAEYLLFCDEDSEPIFRISLDAEFEIEGGDGDWFLSNSEFDIYI